MTTFHVQGPDGKEYMVDTPEGSTEQDAIKYIAESQYGIKDQPKISAQSLKNAQQKYDPTEGMGTGERLLAGIGSGMERFTRGAGNLGVHALNAILPDDNSLSSQITKDHRAIKGGWFSDEALKEQDQLDKPLGDTTAGSVGQFVGQTAASLPLSLGFGAASSAARAVPIAGRALGSPLLRAGVEGATNAAITADPDERGNAAIEGGLFGGLLHMGGSALGRTIRGLLQKSDATQDLEHLADQGGREIFVPASQAGGEEGDLLSRMTGAVYKHMLPLFPGVSGQLKRQGEAARGVVRDLALSESDPVGTIIKPGAGKDATMAMQQLADAFDQEYKSTVGSYSFNVPSDLASTLENRIKGALPNVDQTTLEKTVGKVGGAVERFASGQATIEGENLLNAKNAISQTIDKMSDGPEKKAMKAAAGWFDDHISDEMNSGNAAANQADLAKYQQLEQPLSNFRQVSDAIEAAKAHGGRFTPSQLASAADSQGTIAHLGQTANEALGGSAATPSTEGRILAYLAGGYGAFHGLAPGALSLTAGANVLATKTAQRVVMGDTAAQQAVTKMLEAHPDMFRRVQQIIRLMGSTSIGRANVNPNGLRQVPDQQPQG